MTATKKTQERSARSYQQKVMNVTAKQEWTYSLSCFSGVRSEGVWGPHSPVEPPPPPTHLATGAWPPSLPSSLHCRNCPSFGPWPICKQFPQVPPELVPALLYHVGGLTIGRCAQSTQAGAPFSSFYPCNTHREGIHLSLRTPPI